MSNSIYQEVKKVIPGELTPEEDLKKRQEVEKRLEDKKRKLEEEVKDQIKDLKVDEKGEGPTGGEPPKKKHSPSSSSEEPKNKKPENNSDSEGSSSSDSSSSSGPALEIFPRGREINQSFFRPEDAGSLLEVKPLTPEENEEVDLFLGELEYFQNFFNLNEYDKRAGEYRVLYIVLFCYHNNV